MSALTNGGVVHVVGLLETAVTITIPAKTGIVGDGHASTASSGASPSLFSAIRPTTGFSGSSPSALVTTSGDGGLIQNIDLWGKASDGTSKPDFTLWLLNSEMHVEGVGIFDGAKCALRLGDSSASAAASRCGIAHVVVKQTDLVGTAAWVSDGSDNQFHDFRAIGCGNADPSLAGNPGPDCVLIDEGSSNQYELIHLTGQDDVTQPAVRNLVITGTRHFFHNLQVDTVGKGPAVWIEGSDNSIHQAIVFSTALQGSSVSAIRVLDPNGRLRLVDVEVSTFGNTPKWQRGLFLDAAHGAMAIGCNFNDISSASVWNIAPQRHGFNQKDGTNID